MKRKVLIYGMLLVLLSACGAPAAPTIDAASVQSTSAAAAFTIVAQTQAALPTNTAMPPTEAPTQTPAPTNTPAPSATSDILATSTVITLPTDLPLPTSTSPSAGNDPCNHALVTWQGPSASFTMVNETKPQGSVILLMSVVTELGECGWLNIYSDSFTGPVGTYSAGAFVDGPKDFKVFGAFRINSSGGWKIVVRNDVITAQGSCYPRC
jgi:hypothetical protein